MKKIIALCLLVIVSLQILFASDISPYDSAHNDMQAVKEYYAEQKEEEISATYTGDPEYLNKVMEYDFNDVKGKEKAEAVRLALFGITEGVGEKRFAPNQKISNIAALTMLVRLFGDEAAIVDKVTADNGEAPSKYFNAVLQDAYYEQAKKLGILEKGEEVPYNQLVTRQQLARWFVDGAKLQLEEAGKEYFAKYNWNTVEPRNIKPLKTMLEKQLMMEVSNDIKANSTLTRQQMADIISAYYDKFISSKEKPVKFELDYAIVMAKEENLTNKITSYKLRRQDGKLVEIVLNDSEDKSKKTGLAVYKNGKLLTDTTLTLGDQIAYYFEGDSIKYVEVLEPFSVTERLLNNLSSNPELKVNQGAVLSNLSEQDKVNGNKSKVRIRLLLDNNGMVDLVSSYDHVKHQLNEYPIISGSTYIKAEDVAVGSPMTIYTIGDNIIYASIGSTEIKTVQGFLREIDPYSTPRTVTVLDFDDNIIKTALNADTTIRVNYYQAPLRDLKVGIYVEMLMIGDRVKSLHALSYQPEFGKIPENGKIVYGNIKSLSGNMLNLDSGKFLIDDQTKIVRGTRAINSGELNIGDSLKLYFNSINTNVASKIEASDDNDVKYLLKGKLYNYNQYNNQLELGELSKLHNTMFEPDDKLFSESYPVARGVEIYDGDKKLTTSELNNDYFKRDAYFVLSENFGRDQVLKIVFKNGFERHYNDAINDYNHTLKRFELQNRVNFDYGSDTIFIRDDRVVDEDALHNNTGAYVLSNERGGLNTAKVVSLIGGVDRLFDNVYIGTLERVNPYDIIITNYSLAKDFRFSEPTQEDKTLYLSDESEIFDSTKGKMISRAILFNGKYSKSENRRGTKDKKGTEYRHYYGIFVTDGSDNLLACNLRYKGWFKNRKVDEKVASDAGVAKELKNILVETRFVKGRIVSFSPKWQRIEITDSAYYVPYYRHWKNSINNLYMELNSAVIMKNGKKITYSDLKEGDYIHAIRYDDEAFIVYVQ